MRYLKILFSLGLVTLLVFSIRVPNKKDLDKIVSIAGSEIKVELADTQEKRILGLSGREFLAEDQGIFFIFDEPGRYSFWMKDMNFPIDIIWIGEDLRIINIDRNVEPETFPQSFLPPIPVSYVLEVNADWAEKNDIHIGERVDKFF